MPCESITNCELGTQYTGLKMDEAGHCLSYSMEEQNALKDKRHDMF